MTNNKSKIEPTCLYAQVFTFDLPAFLLHLRAFEVIKTQEHIEFEGVIEVWYKYNVPIF
jgi:hypothetical protein